MVWLVLTLSLWTPASRADVQLEGEGVLGLRNLMERSLEIGGTEYFLTEASIILDHRGAEVTLERLSVAEAEDEPRLLPIQGARFWAMEVRGRNVIQRIELTESPPR